MEKLRFMGSRSCYYLLHPHKTTTERKQQQQQQKILVTPAEAGTYPETGYTY